MRCRALVRRWPALDCGRAIARSRDASSCTSPRSTPGRAATCAAPRRVWDTLLDEYPRDLIALKVSQFVLSYLGESDGMRERVARVLPAWSADDPGYGFVLGCYAYALEESGDYRQAEDAGRRAVELDRGDIWAAHAVAHVAEMEGRLRTASIGSPTLAERVARVQQLRAAPQVARGPVSPRARAARSRARAVRSRGARRVDRRVSRRRERGLAAVAARAGGRERRRAVERAGRRAPRRTSTITRSCSSICTTSWRSPRPAIERPSREFLRVVRAVRRERAGNRGRSDGGRRAAARACGRGAPATARMATRSIELYAR